MTLNFGEGFDKKYAEIGIKNQDKVIVLEFESLPALFSPDLSTLNVILDSIDFRYKKEPNFPLPNKYSFYTNANNFSMIYPSKWYEKSDDYFSILYPSRIHKIVSFEYSHTPYLGDSFGNYYEGYWMVIDVQSTFDKGSDYSVDYASRYTGNEPFDKWRKYVYEISSNGHYRTLDSKYDLYNTSTFDPFYNPDNFILMDFDLKQANFPAKYSIYIYKINGFDIDNERCEIIDTTGWVPIPPPKFSISASPDSINLRPNEEKNVKLQIHNNSTLNANLTVSILDKQNEGLNVTPIPTTLSLIPNSDNSLNIKVKNTSNKQDILSHVVPINLRVSFPQNTTIFGQNVTIPNTVGADTMQSYYYTVTTLPDKNTKDYLDELAGWISPLNILWTFLAAIGGLLVPFLIRMYTKQKQNEGRSNTTNNQNTFDSKRSSGAPF
jgi:hypothetical protein